MTTISTTQYQFILQEINNTGITRQQAYSDYGITDEEFDEADVDQNGYIDLYELDEADDILAKLAVVVEEKQEEKETQESEEDKKQKETQVNNNKQTKA